MTIVKFEDRFDEIGSSSEDCDESANFQIAMGP